MPNELLATRKGNNNLTPCANPKASWALAPLGHIRRAVIPTLSAALLASRITGLACAPTQKTLMINADDLPTIAGRY
jgi:hypothetical protein